LTRLRLQQHDEGDHGFAVAGILLDERLEEVTCSPDRPHVAEDQGHDAPAQI
jgi:hypothetical protein